MRRNIDKFWLLAGILIGIPHLNPTDDNVVTWRPRIRVALQPMRIAKAQAGWPEATRIDNK